MWYFDKVENNFHRKNEPHWSPFLSCPTPSMLQCLLCWVWGMNDNFIASPSKASSVSEIDWHIRLYKTIITPGVAAVSKLHWSLLQFRGQSYLSPNGWSSLRPVPKKSVGFQIGEERTWLILNGYSSCILSLRGTKRATRGLRVLTLTFKTWLRWGLSWSLIIVLEQSFVSQQTHKVEKEDQ